MKTDLFQSCGHCWIFCIYWYIECSSFITSSFRIWNSSTGIPSPPLALFIVMLPKAHLTSHSRMSGSRWWPHHRGYLSHEFFFLIYISSVCSYHLFLISSASVRSKPFLCFVMPIFGWKVPLVSVIFLKCSLVCPHSIIFLYFFSFILLQPIFEIPRPAGTHLNSSELSEEVHGHKGT